MEKTESKILSHLHDTLFLCYESCELVEILKSFHKDTQEIDSKTYAVDLIVEHVRNNFTSLVRGNEVKLPKATINVFEGARQQLNDTIMNLDMIRNNQNPASIMEHYRSNPIDPDFMVGHASLVMSNGDKLSIFKGEVYVNDDRVDDSPEVQAIQKASIDWLSKAPKSQVPAYDAELSI